MRRMTDGGSEPGVVLECYPADASLDLLGILFGEIFHDIELHIAPSFAGESVYRVNVAHRLERFAHQDEPLFLDLDYPPAGIRVWLEGIARDRTRGRRRLIKEYRDRDITLLPKALCVDVLRLATVSLAIDDEFDERIQI